MNVEGYACDTLFIFFKQKTAYELSISDWSADVCSSDLSDSVLKEIDLNLNAHQLIKVRIAGEEREARNAMLETICESLSCARFTIEERSEDRRVEKECVSKCKCRWTSYNSKNKHNASVPNTVISKTLHIEQNNES